jgi:hypothetical protein
MLPLVSHINRDDDILEPWLQYYLRLGVTRFDFVVHGGREENRTLYSLLDKYPIAIRDEYAGDFDPFEKRDRVTRVLKKLHCRWVILVDSDEFLELPYSSLRRTLRVMEWLRAVQLPAPMLQRFAGDGSIDVGPEAGVSDAFPWCSTDLYARLGQPQAIITKYPLFRITRTTALRSGGFHYPPNGKGSRTAPMMGVTHHFKWRPAVRDRLELRANSTHPYRGESVQYLSYLSGSAWKLPTDGAFRYSRAELFRRGLLKRASLFDLAFHRCDISEIAGGKDLVLDRRRRRRRITPEMAVRSMARKGHKEIVLCGAGSGGALFLDALAQHEVKAVRVVDRDQSRWGTDFHGIPVCGLDDALNDGHRVFLAASLSYGRQMRTQIIGRASELGVQVRVFTVPNQGVRQPCPTNPS